KNGVLDTKFTGAAANSELVPKAAGQYLPAITDVTPDASGRIVVFGTSTITDAPPYQNSGYFAISLSIARLEPDFSLDPSFAPQGVARINLPNLYEDIVPPAFLSDGRAVLATTFGDGRGPLFSLEPDVAGKSGVFVNDHRTLVIRGTSGDDLVSIERAGARLRVRFNGHSFLFKRSGVARIAATLFDGNDRFALSSNLPSATVFGGAGDD